MGKKATKATRKFAASGQLKKQIQQRRKVQDFKRKAERRKTGSRKGKEREGAAPAGDEKEGDDEEVDEASGKFKGMSVDDFLGGSFMEGDDDDEEMADAADSDEEDEDEDKDGIDDDESFASIDDLDDDEGAAHLQELSKLAEKDPEFFKYLQENDKELLDFDPSAMQADDEEDEDGAEEDEDEEMVSVPTLTKNILQKWQKAILEQRSLRALRKLLIAFRSAVHMNEEDQVVAWSIDDSAVYNKLITTAFKYTPVILAHHCPYKTLPEGRFKGPTQNHKWKTLQKLILSYFHNVMHLLSQLTDDDILVMALEETAKLVPYVTSSRKAVKVYLKTCLELWSTAEDKVRIAAFLSVRKLASSTDTSLLDIALKNTYLTLVRACKQTSAHTLPSINLMKNSASELYTIDHATSYPHAFGYIRQLAILLRNSMKQMTKESYKQVYNWQYVHCVDFWAIVLARACDRQKELERGAESELRPLIYPLVQVSQGAIKLIPNARSYPYHLHLSRSLLHLSQHTHTYIPLAPTLIPMVVAPLTGSFGKGGSLRPLDLETTLRAPQQYLRTRVYGEGVVDEACFVLAEYLASAPVHASVAFPEITVPILAALRHAVKAAHKPAKGAKGKGRGKEAGTVKTLVDRVEESARWVEERRRGVAFAPGKLDEVHRWESSVKVEETPLGKFVRVQRKAREKRRKLMEKARDGEGEVLDED
ncbi:Noc2 domain-containing protein [Phanerochaete sordida]|uniref:Noc2 domain-containing protein n=1 Tax=Phanerochaete sordida TaxID=48140 RepID=A0A9P3LL88_9APHY|nr:Noc2 domain-containing protein [Phanerochaete sordida]